MPDTGIVRKYRFEAKRAVIAPDGYNKKVILVNGQFPGPMIEANWGDWIEVNVINSISGPEEGFALHWHGLQQRGTPWLDGVPGVTVSTV
jgi:FtsP/CotA-like multicopper oxidase with cupredoxin domain